MRCIVWYLVSNHEHFSALPGLFSLLVGDLHCISVTLISVIEEHVMLKLGLRIERSPFLVARMSDTKQQTGAILRSPQYSYCKIYVLPEGTVRDKKLLSNTSNLSSHLCRANRIHSYKTGRSCAFDRTLIQNNEN